MNIWKSLITKGKGCGLGSSVNIWNSQIIYPVIIFALESCSKTRPVFGSMRMALIVTEGQDPMQLWSLPQHSIFCLY